MKIKVIKENDYNLAVGTILTARRKDGDGSPYPIDAFSMLLKKSFQFKEHEVEVIEP